jgi:hypothetical protein
LSVLATVVLGAGFEALADLMEDEALPGAVEILLVSIAGTTSSTSQLHYQTISLEINNLY